MDVPAKVIAGWIASGMTPLATAGASTSVPQAGSRCIAS